MRPLLLTTLLLVAGCAQSPQPAPAPSYPVLETRTREAAQAEEALRAGWEQEHGELTALQQRLEQEGQRASSRRAELREGYRQAMERLLGRTTLPTGFRKSAAVQPCAIGPAWTRQPVRIPD